MPAGGRPFLDTDYFLTVAELAVALAGFGSLASLIGRSSGAESAAVDAGRLRGMLERSLSVMVLAVFPVALSQFDLAPGIVWGACATIFVIAAPFLHFLPIRRMQRLPEYRPGFAYQASGHAGMVLTIGLLVLGLLGVLPVVPAYGFALVIELSMAAGMFVRVASSLMATH